MLCAHFPSPCWCSLLVWTYEGVMYAIHFCEFYTCTSTLLCLENTVSLELSTTLGSNTLSWSPLPYRSLDVGGVGEEEKLLPKYIAFFKKKIYIPEMDAKVGWILGMKNFGISALIKKEADTALKYEKLDILYFVCSFLTYPCRQKIHIHKIKITNLLGKKKLKRPR